MGAAIACETAGGTGVGPAVMRYCFTYGFGVMARSRLELGLDPIHVRPELLALALDLVVLALLAHAEEVLLPGAVLRDPLAGELAGLDLAQELLHGGARLVRDDALAAREVAVLGGVGDRVAHPGDALLVHQVDDELELVEALE